MRKVSKQQSAQSIIQFFIFLFSEICKNANTFLYTSMYALNKIQIIGHLTEKPEVRQTPQGTSVVDLNVKCIEKVQKEDGSEIVLASYHTVTLWQRMAEIAGDYCIAGSQVYLSGRIKTDSWEHEGQKRYKTKMIAEDLILLDSRKEMAPLPETSAVAGGLNLAEVIGNITKDPELRQTTNGQNVTNFNVATNRKWQDRATGESKEETEFHSVVAWGELAKTIAEIIKVGQKVYVQGRMQTRSWETPDGEKRYATEIIADKVLSLGGKSAEFSGDTSATPAQAAATPTTTETPAKEKTAPAASPEIPEIKYESDIKPEDLPF